MLVLQLIRLGLQLVVFGLYLAEPVCPLAALYVYGKGQLAVLALEILHLGELLAVLVRDGILGGYEYMQHTAVALGYIQNGVAAVKLLGLLIGLVILGVLVVSILLGL